MSSVFWLSFLVAITNFGLGSKQHIIYFQSDVLAIVSGCRELLVASKKQTMKTSC